MRLLWHQCDGPLSTEEMDLRDIVREHPDKVVGHKPVETSMSLRAEVRRFSRDPLDTLFGVIDDSDAAFIRDDVGRYRQAFSWYALSLERTLIQGSTARRCNSQLRYHPRKQKYFAQQRILAAKLRQIGPFLELDYQNLIIHACILLDRAITLSRRFLTGRQFPSFTSFSKHKAYLWKNPGMLDVAHAAYVARITGATDWFDIPLKVLRDKYLMHSAERHTSFFGWRGTDKWNLEMLTMIPASPDQQKLFEKVKIISFNPRSLARDMESFLGWFASYGIEKIKMHPEKASSAPRNDGDEPVVSRH